MVPKLDRSSEVRELIQRYYAQRVRMDAKHAVTATSLYENYCRWCEDQHMPPLALPEFGRWFGLLGVAKARIAGRERYLGIALVGGAPLSADHSVRTYCRDRLCSDPQASLTLPVLYEDYLAWADAKGYAPFSLRYFRRELEKLGNSKKWVAEIRYVGIAFSN